MLWDLGGVDSDHSDKIIMVKYKHLHYNFQTLGGFSISLVLLVKRQRLCWFGRLKSYDTQIQIAK